MVIKVLGPACSRCKEAESIVRAAVREADCPATVEKVTDFKTMMELGVLSTPAVVIDGALLCSGRVPTRNEVLGWLSSGAGPA